ncbi:Fungal specific transcription factor domain family protein [Clavispora lusitaniae]|uniref:Fungal specific transcription factor domain family protein n=1 Tax=Clavispora lusitaniae TaxID=36911 RepID=UPI0016BB3E14|nr:hypothetical protein E0198_002466 [Clavispora lusitaniae]KAF7579988.1 Fungal specific transcription factor domain family protein [Clavispora lusitaniae]
MPKQENGVPEEVPSRSETPIATPMASYANSMASTNSVPPSTYAMRPSDQKRRRVTRACDNCRLKKVKCDGKQPCIHCTVYSYNCTYDRPNVRNKKAPAPLPSTPQTNLLQSIAMNRMPSVSTINANLVLCQNIMNLLFPKLRLNFLEDRPQNFDFNKFQKVVGYLQNKNPSNINLHEISELYLDNPTPSASPISHVEHHVGSTGSSDDTLGAEIKIILPPKEVALQLIFTTWNKACVLFRFYHRPSLLEEVDLLYSLDPLHYTDRQQKFLPFMYSILACGSLFSRQCYNDLPSNETLEDDGFKYFLEARKLIDITNVGDIPSIQTIVMMIIYLQCSARLSTCYSYIGIALRSALKEGLHRNLSIFQSSKRKLDPIEVDTRKRLFFTIYKMDIYINSLLGLPRSISEDEFDQEFPVELDDEYITREAYLFDKQEGRLSSAGCANHHTKLTIILSEIMKELYPIKAKPKNSADAKLSGGIHDKVTELEFKLKKWLENLPAELKPTDPNDSESGKQIPDRFKLANYYLHLSFLNCQISLYRPFIHYISNGYQSTYSDSRSLIRGRNCIKVARMVVKLANKMIDQNLLVGTYWFSMYTIFFSIACLIYYFHFANYNNQKNNQMGVNYAGVLFDDDLNIEMIRKDIEIGRKVLDTLKNMSNASLRIYNILNNLFEQLNRRTADTSLKANLMSGSSSIEANDASVQVTLRNFDKINDFKSNTSSQNRQNEEGFKFVNTPNSEKNEAEKQLFDLFTKPSKTTEETNSFDVPNVELPEAPVDGSNESSLPSAKPEVLDPQVNMPSFIDTPLDYMPGVIDTLDTQIFGRILPPYMLEGNKKLDSMDGKPSDKIFKGFDQQELNSLTFDPSSFDSLDPFNPNQ